MNRSRSTRKQNQDLELRLGHSELEKQSTLLTSQNVALDNLVIVEDDDDEVQLSSSRIFGHNGVRPSSSRISVQSRNGVSRRTIRVPVIKEEDLELRLGLGGAFVDLVMIEKILEDFEDDCFDVNAIDV